MFACLLHRSVPSCCVIACSSREPGSHFLLRRGTGSKSSKGGMDPAGPFHETMRCGPVEKGELSFENVRCSHSRGGTARSRGRTTSARLQELLLQPCSAPSPRAWKGQTKLYFIMRVKVPHGCSWGLSSSLVHAGAVSQTCRSRALAIRISRWTFFFLLF